MAQAEIETETVVTETIVLTLDAQEAGYLLDLLSAHVGGSLTTSDQPLGRIRSALHSAKVKRINAWNQRGSTVYASLFATLTEAEKHKQPHERPWRSPSE